MLQSSGSQRVRHDWATEQQTLVQTSRTLDSAGAAVLASSCCVSLDKLPNLPVL